MDERLRLILVDDKGDSKLLVGGCALLVSSARMSAVSKPLKDLFKNHGHCEPATIDLSSEDLAAFHIICLSAHGFFVPQQDISSAILVKLAEAIQKYHIPRETTLYNTVLFSLVMRISSPSLISSNDLVKLLHVAKTLDRLTFQRLLEDVFRQHALHFDALPVFLGSDLQSRSCAVLLANLMFKVAACRTKVAEALMSSVERTSTEFQQERYELAVWIMLNSPSLEAISSCLANIDKSRQIRSIIAQSTAEVTAFLLEIAEPGIRHTDSPRPQNIINLDGRRGSRRLDLHNLGVHVIEEEDGDNEEFEDIFAYEAPIDDVYENYMNLDDNASITSARTI